MIWSGALPPVIASLPASASTPSRRTRRLREPKLRIDAAASPPPRPHYRPDARPACGAGAGSTFQPRHDNAGGHHIPPHPSLRRARASLHYARMLAPQRYWPSMRYISVSLKANRTWQCPPFQRRSGPAAATRECHPPPPTKTPHDPGRVKICRTPRDSSEHWSRLTVRQGQPQ